jgi:hypothetical protein
MTSGVNVLKHFSSSLKTRAKRVFVLEKSLQQSRIYADKAGACLSGAPFWKSPLG